MQGEVLGAAPSLAVTEMEVRSPRLEIHKFWVSILGGRYQHDLHCAGPLTILYTVVLFSKVITPYTLHKFEDQFHLGGQS